MILASLSGDMFERLEHGEDARISSCVWQWLVACSQIGQSHVSWNSNATQKALCMPPWQMLWSRKENTAAAIGRKRASLCNKKVTSGTTSNCIGGIERAASVLSHVGVSRKSRTLLDEESVHQVAQRMHGEEITRRPCKRWIFGVSLHQNLTC